MIFPDKMMPNQRRYMQPPPQANTMPMMMAPVHQNVTSAAMQSQYVMLPGGQPYPQQMQPAPNGQPFYVFQPMYVIPS